MGAFYLLFVVRWPRGLRMLAVAKLGGLSLILGTCVVEGEKGLLHVVSTHVCTYDEENMEKSCYHHCY